MNQNGFVKLTNFFTQEEADTITSWGNQFNDIKEEKGKWMIYYESNGNRSRIEYFLPFIKEIKDFVDTKLTPLLEGTIGCKMNLFKDKMNWKQGKGKGFRAHQDHPAWSDFPVERFYSIALFPDASTIDNGCLQFVENKNNELLPHDLDENGKGSGDLLNPEQFDWNHIETTPRDILIFDSYAPHRSDDNITDSSRRIFYFTYNPEETGDFYDSYNNKKRTDFPPENEREGKEYNGDTKYNLANPLV